MGPELAIIMAIASGIQNAYKNKAMRDYNNQLERQSDTMRSEAEANQATNNQIAQQDFLTQMAITRNPELISQFRQKYGQNINQNIQSYQNTMSQANKLKSNKQPVGSEFGAFFGGALQGLPFLLMDTGTK